MKLSLKYQGVKGKEPLYKENVGFVCAIFGSTSIVVDNYKGFAETYEKRNESNIKIMDSGKTLYDGNISTLMNILELEKTIKEELKEIKVFIADRASAENYKGYPDDLFDVDMDSEEISYWDQQTRENHSYDLGVYNVLKRLIKTFKK